MLKEYYIAKKIVVISFLVLCLLLVACQNEEQEKDDFTILIFSSLPELSAEKMKVFSKEVLNHYSEIEMYPPVFERLVVEVASHHGDVIIVERDLLPSIYDADGLYSLVELRNEINTVKLDASEQGAMIADEQISAEIDKYENALRIIEGTAFFYEENQYEEVDELVVVIPIYTQFEKEAFALVERLVQK